MSDQIPLHELNKHLFASMLPATHSTAPAPEAPKVKGRVKPKNAAEEAAVQELRDAGMTTDAPNN